MKRFIEKLNTVIEAFCNFFFAIIIVFIFFVFLSPLINLLKGHSGIGWVLITIAVMGILCLVISFGLDYAFDQLDRIKKGELFSWFFKPIRNISSVIGIYGVFKIAYFMINSGKAPSVSSWKKFVLEFLTKL